MKHILLITLSFTFLGAKLPEKTPAEELPHMTLALKPKEPNFRADTVKSFPNGNPAEIVFYQPLSNNTETAVKRVIFLENGRIHQEIDLQNGEPHGTFIEFHAEGQLAKAATYVNGVLEGECRHFFPSGKTSISQHFHAGKLQGKALAFFEDGQVKETAVYKDGSLDGELV